MKIKLLMACALSLIMTINTAHAGFFGDLWDKTKDAVSDVVDYIGIGVQYTAGGANLAGHYLEGFYNRNFSGNNQSSLPDLRQWQFKAMALQRDLDKDVPLSEATFLMTHNSYNAKDYQNAIRYVDPNQHYNLVKQLMVGVRSLELDVEHHNGRLRLCHKVCSIDDRYFTQGLEEIADWYSLPSSRDEVLLIYIEDYIGSSHYDEAVSEIESRIGSLVYRPSDAGNTCQGIPMTISKQDVLDAGKNIILMGDSEACAANQSWKSWVYGGVADKLSGYPTGNQGSELHQGGTCAAGKGFDRNFYNNYLIRFFEDRTILSAADAKANGRTQEHLNDTDIVEILKCGANMPGVDHLGYEGGNRFAAMVWSWDVNEPNNWAGNQDCAIQKANGRWDDTACTNTYHFACHNPNTRQWSISSNSAVWNEGQASCAALGAGYEFSAPYNSYENEQLKLAKANAAISDTWLNYNDIKLESVWKKGQGEKLIYGSWVNSQGTSIDSLSNPMAKFTLVQDASVQLNLSSSTVNTYMHLLDANKNLITSDDNSGNGNDARINLVMNAGTYYVVAATATANQKGHFTLTTNHGELSFVNGLAVKAINSYHWVYDDHDTGSDQDIAMWRPNVPAGYVMLGDVAMNRHGVAPTYHTIVVQDNPGATAQPSDYTMMWHDRGSGGTHDVSFWRPVAPAGYTCLGSVSVIGYNKPSTNMIRCVRSEYVLPAKSTRIWSDIGSGADWDGSAWVALTQTRHEMNTGAFIAGNGHGDGGLENYHALNKHYFLPEVKFENKAQGKSTSQSSTGWDGPSDKAVDGNTDGYYDHHSVTHTHVDTHAWWQVDLNQLESISNIQLFNRTDCCTERLRDFYVLISETPFASRSLTELLADGAVWKQFHSGVAATQTGIEVAGIKGRYVRIQLNHADHLSLAEVKVNAVIN